VIALLAVLALPLFGERAAAQDTFEYVIQPGDTCTSIAARFFGSAREYERLHALNPGLGPLPHVLVPGSRLVLPREASGPEARLTAVERDVRARAPGNGDWNRARIGLDLRRGHQVVTEAQSSAEITFRDRSILEMREHSLVVVYGGSERLASRTRRATLERGALRSRLDELAGALAVETPRGRAAVGDGEAIVVVAADGTSRLSNLSGADAALETEQGRVVIPAGSGSLVTSEGRIVAPRPLPPAPRWANDLAGRFVGLTGAGATLSGSWLPVPGALAYRVEVARQPDGRDVVAALEVRAPATAFSVSGIVRGTYYVSVATIDRDALEGRPSPRRAMTVLEARLIDPDGDEPRTLPHDPGDPSLPRELPALFAGTWIVSPLSYRCAEGANEPRELATLRTVGEHAVRCFDVRDREVPAFSLRVVGIDVAPEPSAVAQQDWQSIALDLRAELPLPAQLVAWSDTAGVEIGRIERHGRAHSVRARVFDPSVRRFAIAVGVQAATEKIELGRTEVDVLRPGAIEPDRPAAPPPIEEVLVAAPFDTVHDPAFTSIRATGHSGVVPWLGLEASGAGGDRSAGARATIGASARVFDEPLRLRIAWTLGIPELLENDLGALLVGGSFRLDVERFAFDLEIAGWIVGGAESGLALRVAPSIGASLAATDWLAFHVRQGVTSDLGDQTDWTSAYAVELRPIATLSITTELDLSLGHSTLARIGAGAAMRFRWIEPFAGLSIGLTSEAQARQSIAGHLGARVRF
jgi:hypothetical protein